MHADCFLTGVDDYGSALDPFDGTRDATPGASLSRLRGRARTELTPDCDALAFKRLLEELSRVLQHSVFSHLCPGVEGAATYGG